MPSCQVRDVIDHVRSYHRHLAKQLESLGKLENAAHPRMQLLLNYMGRYEKHFEKALGKYEAGAEKSVLDTWLKYVPDDSLDRALKHLDLHDGMDAGDILRVVLSFDKSLIELFQELAEETPLPDVNDLFTDLLRMEDSKDRQYAISVLEISDA
jgi:hypothetical protein